MQIKNVFLGLNGGALSFKCEKKEEDCGNIKI